MNWRKLLKILVGKLGYNLELKSNLMACHTAKGDIAKFSSAVVSVNGRTKTIDSLNGFVSRKGDTVKVYFSEERNR